MLWNRQRAKNNYRADPGRKLEYQKGRQQSPECRQLVRKWRKNNPDKLDVYKERNKQKYREKSGYNPAGRTCSDCGADISHMGHRAKRCKPCSTPPARTCRSCHADISKRGSRAQYCNKECSRSYWQSKELDGYTKTCTKCHETKEHTEFGWHNGFRRPTCRDCEVRGQTERFRNFTPEQTTRRNQRKRELGQLKRANQSPEEKAMARTKARQAQRRKLYGSEFNENELYLEQEGKCAICKESKALEEFELDHDRMTKKFRGFLCKNCNLKLLPRYEKFPIDLRDSHHLNAYLLVGKH